MDSTTKIRNQECFCVSLDADALERALESEIGQIDLFALVRERCPYVFASRPVFLTRAHIARMAAVVTAVVIANALRLR